MLVYVAPGFSQRDRRMSAETVLVNFNFIKYLKASDDLTRTCRTHLINRDTFWYGFSVTSMPVFPVVGIQKTYSIKFRGKSFVAFKSQRWCHSVSHYSVKLCVLLGRKPELIRAAEVFLSPSERCNTTWSESLSCGTESDPQCQLVISNLHHKGPLHSLRVTDYCSFRTAKRLFLQIQRHVSKQRALV